MPKREKIQIEIEVPTKTLNLAHAACPKGHLLSNDEIKIHGLPSIYVKVKYRKQMGDLYLDSTYGSFDNVYKGITVPDNAVVELFCPECQTSLTDKEERCQLCSAPLFMLHLPKGSKLEGCLRKGCFFHKMKIIDADKRLGRLFENQTLESYL
jgi:hypothetical protein